ncbi:DUF1405 domain-containing protein [Alkalihalobacillus sp. BA299]|uniref:DUF1405 domain-containing protein n=1 Tax=Alkalihalobacillus sp. BA299 TaxID=2815938 RepID=UPI001ADACFBA|nr:DUF1405 domain-containing protein [Alkalihalobacillus sp. BA299]
MISFLKMFRHPLMLYMLVIINFFGTIYGYYWYKDQLAATPTHFLLFVPDSPTASLFFLFALLAFIIRRNLPLVEAFAAVTLIKYGLWAVAMNIGAGLTGSELGWQNYMLIASHLGMALQAVFYLPYYRIKGWHLLIVALWTLHNDIIDYVYNMHPYVSWSLQPYIDHIGYFTFWLSVFSLFIVYLYGVRDDRLKLSLR